MSTVCMRVLAPGQHAHEEGAPRVGLDPSLGDWRRARPVLSKAIEKMGVRQKTK